MAKVMLKCSGTSDSVYKCVWITATANAYAEATATAHATAVSNAVNACGCLTQAVADGMNNADTYVKLVAEAASTATAEVCVTGALQLPTTLWVAGLHLKQWSVPSACGCRAAHRIFRRVTIVICPAVLREVHDCVPGIARRRRARVVSCPGGFLNALHACRH